MPGGGTTPGTGSNLNAGVTVTLAGLGQIGMDTLFSAFTSGPYSSSYCSSGDATTTGDTQDVDGDGWQANSQTDFSCTSGGGGVTYTVSGSLALKDNDDGDATSGFEEHMNDLKFASTYSDGSGFANTQNVDLVVQRTTPHSNSHYDVTFGFNYVNEAKDTSGATSDKQVVDVQSAPGFTPKSTSAPFAAGTFQFDSTVTFTVNGTSYDVTGASSDLAYDTSTCSGGFNAGTISYADGNGNTAVIKYTGCDSGEYFFNGSSVGTF